MNCAAQPGPHGNTDWYRVLWLYPDGPRTNILSRWHLVVLFHESAVPAECSLVFGASVIAAEYVLNRAAWQCHGTNVMTRIDKPEDPVDDIFCSWPDTITVTA